MQTQYLTMNRYEHPNVYQNSILCKDGLIGNSCLEDYSKEAKMTQEFETLLNSIKRTKTEKIVLEQLRLKLTQELKELKELIKKIDVVGFNNLKKYILTKRLKRINILLKSNTV